MDIELDFDPAQYSRLPPNLDLASTLALARQLVAAAPALPWPGLKRTTTVLARNSQALEAAMAESLRGHETADKRPMDIRTDRSWAAIEKRLSGWLDLSPEDHSEVEQAAVLYKQLFPDGLRFTQLEYGAQWAEAETRIQLIKKDGHEPLLIDLCGKPFVTELYHCHTNYGAMIGAVRAAHPHKGTPERMDAGAQRKKTQLAILAHQAQLVAMRMSGDAAEAAAARVGLQPLDDYREKLTPSRPRKEEPAPGGDGPNSPATP